jgi:hypothetical protein
MKRYGGRCGDDILRSKRRNSLRDQWAASGENRKYSAGISPNGPTPVLKNPLYGGLAGRVVRSSHGSFATECSVRVARRERADT